MRTERKQVTTTALTNQDVVRPDRESETRTSVTATRSTRNVDQTGKTPESSFEQTKGVAADPTWANSLDGLWSSGQYSKIVDHMDKRLAALDVHAFDKMDVATVSGWIEELYVLQHRALAVSNKLSMVDNAVAKKQVLGLLKAIGELQSAVFTRAETLANAKDEHPVSAFVLYRNTMKKPGFHTPTEEERYFVETARSFIQRGGDPSDIKPLSMGFINGLKSNELVEFVVDAVDVARVARDSGVSPGHTLLSWGGDALTAGTLRVFKNDKGELDKVVVGTFSGRFRCGADSLHHMVRHLVAIGVPPEKILIQDGEAAGSATLEFIQRISGIRGAQAQQQQMELHSLASKWIPYPPTEPRISAPAQGARAAEQAAELNEAAVVMRQTVKGVMEDGLILESMHEAAAIAKSVDQVLRLAEMAGNPKAYADAKAVLKHLANLTPQYIDAEGSKLLKQLLVRWDAHVFGTGAADPAEVFCGHPLADRRARIVATLNPKATEAQLGEMVAAGMDVARINTAHGSPEDLLALIQRFRSACATFGRSIPVEIDLPGPKIRLGKFANPKQLEFNDIFLNKGEKLTLTTAEVLGDPTLLPVEYPTLADDVKPGEPIYLNDGTVQLKASKVYKDAQGNGVVEAEVAVPGKVWDRKGINLPGSSLSIKTITDDDIQILDKLLPAVDLVAPSFVRFASDVLELRAEMQKRGKVVPIIAKIERPEGMANLDQIAAVADGLMVARGDLGVEIGLENVPAAERRINAVGNVLGKPVMVATEVMMSMVKDSRPTRGDVEGVYSAIHDQGADAIMLAKETTAGVNPAEVICTASLLISRAEKNLAEEPFYPEKLKDLEETQKSTSVLNLLLTR